MAKSYTIDELDKLYDEYIHTPQAMCSWFTKWLRERDDNSTFKDKIAHIIDVLCARHIATTCESEVFYVPLTNATLYIRRMLMFDTEALDSYLYRVLDGGRRGEKAED